MAGRNILLLGMICYPGTTKLITPVMQRDQERINALHADFQTVFSVDKNSPGADPRFHCDSTVTDRGARKLVLKVLTGSELIHCICVDYIRMTGGYFRSIVIGGLKGDGGPGKPMINFIKHLRAQGKLADGCSLFFAHTKDRAWSNTLRNFRKAFGCMQRVVALTNPLFAATERIDRWGHRGHLSRLVIEASDQPFCRFRIRIPANVCRICNVCIH